MHLDKTVREGNELRWDGVLKPFYETYYLKFVDPEKQWSFWARYTLLIPSQDTGIPSASVWAVFSPLNGNPVAIKKTVPLSETDIFHRDYFIQIKESYLTLDTAYGILENSDHHIQWQIGFEDPTISANLYPHDFLYSFPLPKTKFSEPRLSTFASGFFQVDRNRFSLNHIPSHQAHIWGTQYARRWVWGHCNTFAEDPTAVFEGLVAQINLGPIPSPSLALFHILWRDKMYRANSVIKWISNRSSYDLGEWRFEVTNKGTKFVGHLNRDPSLITGLEYEGPLKEKRYCHNTMMADMTMEIYQKQGGKWVLKETLTANKSAAFETVEPQPDSRIHFVL